MCLLFNCQQSLCSLYHCHCQSPKRRLTRSLKKCCMTSQEQRFQWARAASAPDAATPSKPTTAARLNAPSTPADQYSTKAQKAGRAAAEKCWISTSFCAFRDARLSSIGLPILASSSASMISTRVERKSHYLSSARMSTRLCRVSR